jgi:transglutaminase-like putative cysteine protease
MMNDRLSTAVFSKQDTPAPAAQISAPGLGIRELMVLALLAAWLPYLRPLFAPVMVGDDFELLSESRTWQRTVEYLWQPHNEHVMPLCRLLIFALEQLSGRLTFVPAVVTFVGPVALWLAMLLVYLFVRRELGHPLYGLLALVLLGVTTMYHQAVYWFSASFTILSLDTILLGLLAAQRWRQTGRPGYLVLTCLAALLAPGWFAIGVLAAPLFAVYLLVPARGEQTSFRSRLLPALLPSLGTALFLAVGLYHSGQRIMHAEHYQGRTAAEAFMPLAGLRITARSLVDNLLIGQLGSHLEGLFVPEPFTYLLFAAAVSAAVWWWRPARDRRLMLLGLSLIFVTYWLIYSARATWGYEEAPMTNLAWTRYHLLPHLGLVLFFCGGLAARAPFWLDLRPDGTLTPVQYRRFVQLILILLFVNLPRGLICGETAAGEQFAAHVKQIQEFQRIEDVDALCRRHRVSAEAAREALPRFDLDWSVPQHVNGWDFLLGSNDPQSLPPEEVKRLLEPEPSTDKSMSPRVRLFQFTYAATIAGLEPAQRARIWLPVPPSNDDQQVEIVRKDLPVEGRIGTEKTYGNRVLYLEAKANDAGEIPLRLDYRVRRRELTRRKPSPSDEGARELALLLQPNRLVPIAGKPLELLRGKQVPDDEMQAARLLYDLVDDHLRYSKEGTGWGNGDSVWACENGRGNCTDFHSLFLSLSRAQHMPAKFEIGFAVPPHAHSGEIAGYHCWAKFHLRSGAWMPVDISEANKEPSMRDYYFGNLTADRVAFSTGRDLILEPPQDGPPLNFFIYPHVEVDGRQYSQDKIALRFSFRDEE